MAPKTPRLLTRMSTSGSASRAPRRAVRGGDVGGDAGRSSRPAPRRAAGRRPSRRAPGSRPLTPTRAPARASRRRWRAPMPCVEPVTSARAAGEVDVHAVEATPRSRSALTGCYPPCAVADAPGSRSSTACGVPWSASRSRNGTASNASGPEHAGALPDARGQQLERDDRVDRRLPDDGLHAVARHRLLVVGDVVQVDRARRAVLAGAGHERARARAARHPVAERRRVGQRRGDDVARRDLDALDPHRLRRVEPEQVERLAARR